MKEKLTEPLDGFALLAGHAEFMAQQLVDSALETTRVFWRLRRGATAEQASDPRPWREVSGELERR